MKIKIGCLALVCLFGCGQVRDRGSAGAGGRPLWIGGVSGQSSLGTTTLSLYSGAPDPSRPLLRVGTLEEVIEVTEIKEGAGGNPVEQKSEEVVARRAPVHLHSSGPEKIALAAFLDGEFRQHLRFPVLHSRRIEISPVVRFCAQFEFRGNSHLSHPVKCSAGDLFCSIPEPGTFGCRLDSAGMTECQSWQRSPGMNPAPDRYSRSSFADAIREPDAFVCKNWKQGAGPAFRLMELKKLVRLRIRFDVGVRIRLEPAGDPLDPWTADPKWVQFTEESMDFSWDR